MAIKDWHVEDRPREKLLLRGADNLSDAELLAIFLRTGVKGKNAIELARELLETFDGLRGLMEADEEGFCAAKGLGQAKYVQLKAVVELSRRYLASRLQTGDVMSSPEDTRNYLISRLRGYTREVFACLFLDNQNRVIEFEELFFGTIDGANIYPREVAKRALNHNAAALILAHNHPSGNAEPSRSDVSLTKHLQEVLLLIEVRVLDHFVIGDGEAVSLAQRGLISSG